MTEHVSAPPAINIDLHARFGAVMSTAEVASVLKMTVAALRMARSRNALPLHPLEIEGRRGQIYSTNEVARLLTLWISRGAEGVPPPHTGDDNESQSLANPSALASSPGRQPKSDVGDSGAGASLHRSRAG